MSTMNSIIAIIISLLSLPALYLLLTTIAAYLFKKKENAPNSFLNIGVLIPAHNEEEGIARTVRNVLACDYPANRRYIFVIADNCTDSTAETARNAGATVCERTDEINRGKGQALDWFLRKQKNIYKDTDAITIIDADVNPDTGYLREISLSLSQLDTQAIQAYNGVSNPKSGWRPGLIDAAFNVFNHLRMAGSCQLSGTCVLKGNGMAFRTALLQRTGWPCHSIVEDMEFSLRLLQEEIDVHYNPDAIIRSEMVTSGNNATSQRSRWEGGRFTLVRQMAGPLLKLFLTTGRSSYLIALTELALPPLSLLVLLFAIGTAAALLIGNPTQQLITLSWWAILIIYVASGQIQRKAPLSTWAVLLAAPLYILWKIPIYAAMLLRKKSTSWVRTTREHNKTN
ncbi:glycosyl transferase family 2 [Chlorobium limicola DSM 245]|uniref:Glycosyl transferase family 2 n=1 Tax=Chlorobium limicola (strain DSM 245 / NBRC 103803 / 6330) TaxID=290315 RepID=B3EF29_CHLL2|nr:glycosyltransferase family 2 protein [Chlorobium limicola]ACD90891.1 glycosyl transferase family 2 [Chlorobium limicola DSM 245]